MEGYSSGLRGLTANEVGHESGTRVRIPCLPPIIKNEGETNMSTGRYSSTSTTIKSGITFGSCLAMILSWSVNHSILWAIIHGVCSWFYVIYFAIMK